MLRLPRLTIAESSDLKCNWTEYDYCRRIGFRRNGFWRNGTEPAVLYEVTRYLAQTNSWTVPPNFNYLLGCTNYTAPIDSCSLVPDVILLLTYHAEHWITWKFQHVSVSTSCVQTRSYRRRIGRIIVLENNKMKITRQSTRAVKSQICPALVSDN